MTRLILIYLALSIFSSGGVIPLDPEEARAEVTVQRGGAPAERGRQAERVRRFLQWTVDDLNLSRKVTEEDIAELEDQYDSITPLESAQREADLLSLLDTRYSYMDWLNDRIEEFEEDLAEISADSVPGSGFLENGFLEMESMLKELEKVLKEKIDRFETEEKRLADILERRRLLKSRIDDLEKRLDRIEKGGDDGKRDRGEGDDSAQGIRNDIRLIISEMDSLPQVDEDILMHYRLMIEQGKGGREWLALQIDEFGMLREVAALLPRDTARNAAELEKAIKRTMRAYENEIGELNRKIDGLERLRSGITPAGTLRETEFSRDLSDLYERMQIRYNDLIYRLRIRIGAWNAEAAGITSAGQ